MTGLWVLLGISGGFMVGAALGASWALDKLDRSTTLASNTAVAVFATTIELTYGEEFLNDLIEETKTVMKEYPDLIVQRATRMRVNQALAEFRKKLEEEGGL